MTPRVYVDASLREGLKVELPDTALHHARVLRLREGAAITLFNGAGGEWQAELTGRKHAEVRSFAAVERESPLHITLVQGVSSGERMDYTIQKAVELGVAAIQPVITKKGVVRLQGERASARLQHWRKVVIAACEQCGRNRIPEVLPLMDLGTYLRDLSRDEPRLLLSPMGRSIREIEIGAAATLAAGPEAGFAAEERSMLERAGYVQTSLGPRVLRTETAALAALAALSALQGDF